MSKSYKENLNKYKDVKNPLIYFIRLIFSCTSLFSITLFLSIFLHNLLPQLEFLLTGKFIDFLTQENIEIGDMKTFWNYLIIVLIVVFISKISFEYKIYKDQLYRTQMDFVFTNLIMSKYVNLLPRAFEDKSFIDDKVKLDWNRWKTASYWRNLITFISLLLSAIVSFFLLSFYSWKLFILIILSVIPSVIVNWKSGKRVWSIWDRNSNDKIIYQICQNVIYTNNSDKLQESSVMAYGKYVKNKALKILGDFNAELNKNEVYRLKNTFLTRGIEMFFLGFCYYIVFSKLLDGTFTIGSSIFVLSLFGKVRSYISALAEVLVNLISDFDIIKTFHRLMQYKVVDYCTLGNKWDEKNNGIEIVFEDVWFKYPKTKNWVLNDINLKISIDEDLAIVGKNGAGKSTLMKLLLRIYDPDKGRILINGVDLKEIDLKKYYKKIGFLSQNFGSYGFTVSDNVFLGDTNKPFNRNKVISSLRKADAYDFVMKYPHKLDTFLSRSFDEGIVPSGGQLQKLAIARVFYRDPQLIILDEPTSAIDPLAEEEIFNNINEFAEGKSVIVISHRFATVKKAKKIIVIDKGEIIESGNHSQLVSNNGLYKEMYEKQKI